MTAAMALVVDLLPTWANVARAHAAVELLAFSIYGDEALRDAIAMVSVELLENALEDSAPETGVRLAIHEDGARIVVSVTNAVRTPGRVRDLEARLAWLHGFDSAKAAYLAAIELASEDRGARGGLGIVRIAYEGACEIACDTSTPGLLTVRASMGRSS